MVHLEVGFEDEPKRPLATLVPTAGASQPAGRLHAQVGGPLANGRINRIGHLPRVVPVIDTDDRHFIRHPDPEFDRPTEAAHGHQGIREENRRRRGRIRQKRIECCRAAGDVRRPADVQLVVHLDPRALQRRSVPIKPIPMVAIHHVIAAKSDPPMSEANQVLHDVLGGIPGATTREVDVWFIVAVGDHSDIHSVFRDLDRDLVRLVIDPENEAVDSTTREE